MTRYEKLAQELIDHIESGALSTGERLASVRQAKDLYGVSTATVVSAYDLLQSRGYVRAQAGSGFYVCFETKPVPPTQSHHLHIPQPETIERQALIQQLFESMRKPDIVTLGAAVIDTATLPLGMIHKALSASIKTQRNNLLNYEHSAGNTELRHLLAKRMAMMDCPVSAEDIVITNGCQEALYLALKHLTTPGDMVAIESPTYYGLLQMLEGLGLKAIEIPTHAQFGISIDALALACDHWPIKACIVITCGNNPQGFSMRDDAQQALVSLCKTKGIALIEDDNYGDMNYSPQRPGACKRFSDEVIYCSSFSKPLAAGLRVGWIASRQLAQPLTREKISLNIASAGLPQMAIAHLLKTGLYDKHLRQQRKTLAVAMSQMLQSIQRHFPLGTEYTRPTAGLVTWVQLPENCGLKSSALFYRALEQNIAIAPGLIFSATDKYERWIRLSSGGLWNERKELAMERLGKIILDASN